MRLALTALACALVACKSPAAPIGPEDAAASSLVVQPSSSAAPAVSSAAAAPSSSAAAEAPSAEVAAPEADSAAPDTSLPAVKVSNIGMHIGGGPNDQATKEPIGKSVEPHFEEFRRCFARVFDQKRGGDFGVDLLVPATGGKAKVSHPRTSLKGERFEECVMGVFETIDFEKPRFGLTTVSYSLRFTPGS